MIQLSVDFRIGDFGSCSLLFYMIGIAGGFWGVMDVGFVDLAITFFCLNFQEGRRD
jgi:hypothetical protein